jgi:membrane-bound metal-dependent hydrolase YbcI (DUF457 family)
MMGRTHLMGGAAAWLAGCAVAGASPTIVGTGTAVALAGSLAPDVDHRSAEAAQFCRLAGSAVAAAGAAGLLLANPGPQWALLAAAGVLLALLPWATRPHGGGFRGWVHSLWGAAACALLAFVPVAVGWVPLWAGLAFTAGWASHLILDAMTAEGLRLFWPSQVRYGWFPKAASMRTGGRRPGHRGKGRVGREYVLVQPPLMAIIAVAGWAVVTGVHPL